MLAVDMNDPEVIESLTFLLVPKEEKIQTQARPFDPKKNVFVHDSKEGFVAAEIIDSDATNATVKTPTDTRQVKVADCLAMNPPKYEKCDDMADLSYLNDATVLHNLRERFMSWYIYTYSGLFCVTINPFRRLPVYTMKMVSYYRGKKKNEVPPHLYVVADTAFAAMMRDRLNQSMMITGESGAGKTENTKKVIQYFAFVAASISGKKVSEEDKGKPTLEDQIVSCNPVLESYGNAKTTRNNNSSRFGKFIRIHFTQNFGIGGADIEAYLLEKSRITYQMPAERNYHIFYQMCSKAFPEMVTNDLLLEHDPGLYRFINQGMLTIDKVDDVQEMKDTQKAFDILLFTKEQQLDLFKITAAVMHWGNQKWQQKPREEQAEPNGQEECEKVAKLLGLEVDTFIMGLLKPKIKVGKEFVNKGQNEQQVYNSCAALSKAMYSRAFYWLVQKCNETLDVKNVKRVYFIGVLDIAGFETFEENGFEQLCINFTNERLQQFFNNFMFVLEQEEIIKEGIEWVMESFGADLQATIDLIDKPMGIFSMLEEECVVPKGTDMTYKDKLIAKHLGKHPSFGKPKPSKSKYEAHFEINHYAGIVAYGVNGWLDKNKDPINEYVAGMFKSQNKNQLLAYLFQDIGVEVQAGSKKGSQTISANHRDQVNKLMKTLGATAPHFVRCIIPNEIKTGGIIDAHLVMHQLNCNGVLEGIRICRKGFPSKIAFMDFVLRYCIIDPVGSKGGAADASAAKKASQAILETSGLSNELYRIGINRVLFKAGVLGTLEELRDVAIAKILAMLQSHIRTYLNKKNIQKMIEAKKSIGTLQRNVRAYLELRSWPWFTLMGFVKPLLGAAQREAERLAKEAEEARLRELAQAEERRKAEERAAKAAQIEKHLADAEAANEKLSQENEKLLAALAAQKESNKGGQQRIAELENDKAKLVSDIANLNARISQEEQAAGDIRNELIRETVEKNKIDKIRHQLEGTLRTSNAQIENIERHNAKLENLVKRQEEEINTLTSKFDEEHTELVRVSRKAQVLQEELSEAEAEILKERSAKNKIERQRSDLARKLEELDKELEHSINTQAILNDTRIRSENEINKLKQEMESVIRKHDSAFVQLRTVHEETVNEMSGRISQLIRAINKLEKEKLQLETEYGVSTRPRGQSSSRRF